MSPGKGSPFLGVDHSTAHGKGGFQVYNTALARIGVNICYDCSFPKSARVLMLGGADLIALPTNWPESGGCAVPDFVVPTRALENKVYYAAVNRMKDRHPDHYRLLPQERVS